jgi:hypothetical protein
MESSTMLYKEIVGRNKSAQFRHAVIGVSTWCCGHAETVQACSGLQTNRKSPRFPETRFAVVQGPTSCDPRGQPYFRNPRAPLRQTHVPVHVLGMLD